MCEWAGIRALAFFAARCSKLKCRLNHFSFFTDSQLWLSVHRTPSVSSRLFLLPIPSIKCWSLSSISLHSDCPNMKPSLLKNGRIHGNDSSFGSCLTFSCDPGHTLVGDEEICCIEEGVWNGTVPECFTGNVNRISSFFWVHKVDDGRWNAASSDGDLETTLLHAEMERCDVNESKLAGV